MRALVMLLALHAFDCNGATLSVGPAKTVDADTQELPVLFQAEKAEQVSSLQFEVVLAPTDASWQSIAPASSASTGGKMVSFNRIENARYRVIVAGFNQNVLQDGPVALLRIISKSPRPILTLENLVMSDPNGHAITAKATGTAGPPLHVGDSLPAPPAPRPACGCGATSTRSGSTADLLFISATGLALVLAARRRSAHSTRF